MAGESRSGARPGGSVETADGQTLSEAIAARIRDALFDGRFEPGDFVGSEGSIANDFGVSRMAARDAIRALAAQGIVSVRKGAAGGVRIADGDPEIFARALAVQLRLLGVNLSDLTEAQIAIEAATAELAAGHADAASVAHLEALLREAAAHIDAPLKFTRAIMRFHLALAEASGNIVLSTLLRGVLRVLIDAYGRNTTRERAQGVLRVYESVVEAVAARDGEAARVLMRAHLRKTQANLLASDALAD